MMHMEYVSSNGIKLRTIFLDNGNWLKLFLKHRDLIRLSIIVNVLKLLVCRTSFLGYHHFVCPTCSKSMKVPHSCNPDFVLPVARRQPTPGLKTVLTPF